MKMNFNIQHTFDKEDWCSLMQVAEYNTCDFECFSTKSAQFAAPPWDNSEQDKMKGNLHTDPGGAIWQSWATTTVLSRHSWLPPQHLQLKLTPGFHPQHP